MHNHLYAIYIITNKPKGTLYIGVTNNLKRRISEHKLKLIKGFPSKYNLNHLVYFETTNDVYSVITREKQMKEWHRAWKIRLIEEMNPSWRDLYEDL